MLGPRRRGGPGGQGRPHPWAAELGQLRGSQPSGHLRRGQLGSGQGVEEKGLLVSRAPRRVARSAGSHRASCTRLAFNGNKEPQGVKQENTVILLMLKEVILTAVQVKDDERPG